MQIERIIELQLRGPEPPGERVLRQLVIFMTKQKSFKENYYLLLKCSPRQCTLLPPTRTKSLSIKILLQNARC